MPKFAGCGRDRASESGRTKATIEGALKAKASEAGAAALGKGWTIEEALIMAEFDGDEDATEELESVIMDEPEQLLHVAQQLRDRRESAVALTALIDELKAQGKAIVEDAGHYADEENLYVSAASRADGEPATDKTPTRT